MLSAVKLYQSFSISGPGPVVNTKRTRTGTSDAALLVGDYTNPILKPAAAEIVKKRGEISQSGVAFPDPDAMCMYEPVPYILWNFEIQILQRPDKVTILYNHDHEFREVRMNQPHPAKWSRPHTGIRSATTKATRW